MSIKKILVLCTGNSCRSQIAEGFLKKFLGNTAEVYSAGIETHGVNPIAIKIMQEVGIDLSNHSSNNISEYHHIKFDVVLTVCDNAKESCPIFPNAILQYHHNFPDPAKAEGSEEQVMKAFREVREQIEIYCKELSKQIV